MNQVGKRLKMAVIHDILPEETLVYIFKMLDIKSLFFSWATCKKWKYVIIEFDLFSLKNFSKFQSYFKNNSNNSSRNKQRFYGFYVKSILENLEVPDLKLQFL